MNTSFKISARDYLIQQIIDVLLKAHQKTAETGNVKDLILLSKFILKLSKQFDNECFCFGLETKKDDIEKPPQGI